MVSDNGISRRTALKLAGAGASTALIAGCTSDDDGGEVDPEAWEGVTEIYLEGETQNWIGVEPEAIAGQANPTLVLTEGEEYEVTWENTDGQIHNIEFRDSGGDALEETENMDEQGETQTLTFEATSEMVEYVCGPHETTMVGGVEIQ